MGKIIFLEVWSQFYSLEDNLIEFFSFTMVHVRFSSTATEYTINDFSNPLSFLLSAKKHLNFGFGTLRSRLLHFRFQFFLLNGLSFLNFVLGCWQMSYGLHRFLGCHCGGKKFISYWGWLCGSHPEQFEMFDGHVLLFEEGYHLRRTHTLRLCFCNPVYFQFI